MIYIIAGVSLSGKTTARKYITKNRAISGIDTDTLRSMATLLLPGTNIRHDADVMTNYANMQPVIEAFMQARSYFDEEYLLEGDAIHLDSVQRAVASGQAKAVVVGYPSATVPEVMATFASASEAHWSRNLTEHILRAKAEAFLDYSLFLQAEAIRTGLPFIDASHRLASSEVVEEITQQLFGS